MQFSDIWVLIPAYLPDERMLGLIDGLKEKGFSRILTVDDGGGEKMAQLFGKARERGAQVLTHSVNCGKGAALKTGLRYILDTLPGPVVTCDADGQHTPEDVCRIAHCLLEHPGALVLGTRDKTQMPPRSRVGNSLTCFFLGLLTGLWISDTQTGLRGLPVSALPLFLNLEGDRYEYETNVLIAARQEGICVQEVVIRTIYLDENKGSHFRALRDGLRIYRLLFRQIGKYLGSSLLAGLVDVGVFVFLHALMPESMQTMAANQPILRQVVDFLFPAAFAIPAVLARLVSSLVNYFVNREVVFKSHAGKRSIAYYYVLVAIVLVCDIQIINFLTRLGLSALLSKILADGVMFIASYNVQQKVIFRAPNKKTK